MKKTLILALLIGGFVFVSGCSPSYNDYYENELQFEQQRLEEQRQELQRLERLRQERLDELQMQQREDMYNDMLYDAMYDDMQRDLAYDPARDPRINPYAYDPSKDPSINPYINQRYRPSQPKIFEFDNTQEIICSYDAYDCPSFLTWKDANKVYKACGGIKNDIHYLDGDDDDIPCEELERL